jgi:hypothetical protein
MMKINKIMLAFMDHEITPDELVKLFREMDNHDLGDSLLYVCHIITSEPIFAQEPHLIALNNALCVVIHERLIPGQEEMTDKMITHIKNVRKAGQN